MNLRVSSIIKESNCITVVTHNEPSCDYELIDIAAILLLAVEMNVQQVICKGEAILQAKPLSRLAATLKSFGIEMIIKTNYTYDQLLSKSRRGKYIKALLEYAGVNQ